jgi:hypothetical protein
MGESFNPPLENRMKTKVTLTVSVSPETLEKVRELARLDERSLSATVERMLKRCLAVSAGPSCANEA